MSAQKTLKKLISEVVTEVTGDNSIDIQVTVPTYADFGDFTTNVAFSLTKQLNKSPREIATDIVSRMQLRLTEEKSYAKMIESFSVAGAGFINITLKDDYLFEKIQNFEKNIKEARAPKSERIMIEYGQPNTHKLPHIGHLFSYIIGDSLTRIFEGIGHKIKRANYQGDIGPHVAKSIYGWIQRGKPIPRTMVDKLRLLQECYQEGSRLYIDNEGAKMAIDKINVQIYQGDPEVMDDWRTTRQWSIDYYNHLEAALDVHQEIHYLESEVWKHGKELVEKNMGTIFEESDGAIVFKGEKYGLHTRVFLTKKRTPTYEAKDMGLEFKKYRDWKYDYSIIMTAYEQNAYFDVVIKALELIDPIQEGKVSHIGFGMISLSTGKMSSRTGNILSGVDLIQEITERVAKAINERADLQKEERKDIINKVSMAAIKFTFLKSNALQDTKFDLQESVSFEGKSGPYLLYTYARIQSILAQKQGTISEIIGKDFAALCHSIEERALASTIMRYPLILESAARQRAPHIIAEYLYELGQHFNTFYVAHKVNNAPTEELSHARRKLISLTAETLSHGLNLLGISTVNKM